MIKKIFTFIIIIAFQQVIFAQPHQDKTCDNNEDPILDFNSITKCTIEKPKSDASKSETVKIQVTSRRRVVRKRNAATGLSGNTAANKIASLKNKAAIVGALDLNSNDLLENVPFNLVEEVPLFKSCKSVAIVEQSKCFKEQMGKHIRKNFHYPEKAYDNNIQGRVYAQFIIGVDGTVSNINLRGPYQGELLEKEAKRIIAKLPKFEPGKHNGRAVKVKYGIPVTFKIPGKKPSNIRKNSIKVNMSDAVAFKDIEEVPLFENCDDTEGNKAVTCFNTGIINHVNKYFAYPKDAITNNVQGTIYAKFVIDKEGNVINVQARGPEGTSILEAATIKLFEKLPKFKSSGKLKGNNVNVSNSFPVQFSLN